MDADKSQPLVWTPVDLGPVTVKNRITTAAMTLLYGVDGHLSDRHIAYYEERARGGVGLQVTEEHAAHPRVYGGFVNAVSAYHDASVEGFRRLAAALHAYESVGLIQLFASGVQEHGAVSMDWAPVMGASHVAHPAYNEQPLPLSAAHVRELVSGFARSAQNVAAGGLDGVELHAAHGWLLGQFLSPFFNRRDDEYGGSVQARCRIVLEVGQAVRDAVGDRLAVGVKLSADEGLGDRGITQSDTLAQVRLLAKSELFDYVSISNGGAERHGLQIPSMDVAEAYLAEFGARCKAAAGDRMKVILGHRIRDTKTAEALIERGVADLVAMTRAHLADPAVVNKARNQTNDTIRCAGENECIVRALHAWPVACMLNPATGRERDWAPHRRTHAANRRRVLVIGAGPAGLSAARSVAGHGHEVTIFDQQSEPGGHLRLLARLPQRPGWRDAIDDLVGPLRNAGVVLRTDTVATVPLIRAEHPDAVICATGATWQHTPEDGSSIIAGVPSPRTLDLGTAADRIVEQGDTLGSKVIFYDRGGDYLPLGLAEVLTSAGVAVEIISPDVMVGRYVAESLDGDFVFPRLVGAGVTFTPQRRIVEISGTTVTLESIWGGDSEARADVSSLVLSLSRAPRDSLAAELDAAGIPCVRIGDALAPRRTADAIYDGERIGWTLFTSEQPVASGRPPIDDQRQEVG